MPSLVNRTKLEPPKHLIYRTYAANDLLKHLQFYYQEPYQETNRQIGRPSVVNRTKHGPLRNLMFRTHAAQTMLEHYRFYS